jgi:hypothetical protein
MRADFLPAIEAFKTQLVQAEQRVLEIKKSINSLYELAGEAAPYGVEVTATTPSFSLSAIPGDAFYGKSINTAAREYLEMRKNGGLGPASPRDVYEALAKGGLAFEAKDKTIAIIGVRATLRKNSSLFHRLPSGEYGLLSWYPNAKPPKEEEPPTRKGKAKKTKKAAPQASKKKSDAAEESSSADVARPEGPMQTVAQKIEAVMRGKDFMKVPDIVAALQSAGTPLQSTNPVPHVGSVLSRGKQFYSEKGKGWRLRSPKEPPQEIGPQEESAPAARS